MNPNKVYFHYYIMASPHFTKDECETWLKNPIVNPTTGRRIKLEGPVFNAYIGACMAHGIDIQTEIDKQIADKFASCHNDIDPITTDEFSEMNATDRYEAIKLGSGNCYRLDSIFEQYRISVAEGKPVKDPMNPGYTLTAEDIALIDKSMSEKFDTYVKPGFEAEVDRHPEGFDLRFVEHRRDPRYYVAIVYHTESDSPVNFISNFPSELDEHTTGSVDYTSANFMIQLMAIWTAGELTVGNDPMGTTDIVGLDETSNGLGYWSYGAPPPVPPAFADSSNFVKKAIAIFVNVKDKFESLPAAYRI